MSKIQRYKVFLIPLVYISLVSAFMLWHRSWFSPDQFFVAILLIMIVLGQTRQFLKDWSAPVALYLGYEFARGLVPRLNIKPHVFPMINFDKDLFGFLPTLRLQDLLFSPDRVHWYDYVAVVLYMAHFVIPMLVGFVFWLRDRQYFREYTFAFLFLSYLSFLTFIFFPAVPPWMASQMGLIPHVQEITSKVTASFPYAIDLPTIYHFFGANLIAAVPSLHAAYPWLIFLFFYRKIKNLALLLSPYFLGTWFAVLYLGEHYFFDVLVGVIYASLTFFLITRRRQLRRLFPLFFKTSNPITVYERP